MYTVNTHLSRRYEIQLLPQAHYYQVHEPTTPTWIAYHDKTCKTMTASLRFKDTQIYR